MYKNSMLTHRKIEKRVDFSDFVLSEELRNHLSFCCEVKKYFTIFSASIQKRRKLLSDPVFRVYPLQLNLFSGSKK